METVTIHGTGADGSPVSASVEAEVLSNGSIRLRAPADFDATFAHQGAEYEVQAGHDVAQPVTDR
jgi:hypothetical protein